MPERIDPDQSGGVRVLVTAATGYIGSRIVAPLAKAGFRVRASARTPERLSPDVVEAADEVVRADAFDLASVRASLEGVDTAFYLVHTLGGGADYAERDRRAAELFASAAADAGVRRIVFLGGLGQDAGSLSEHLASRHEVGRLLAEGGVPVVEFRASIVVGSGSTSFEMIRNLVEKLPVMTTPSWVRMGSQPIGIEDVAAYMCAAPAVEIDPGAAHAVYEIGGSEVVTYGDLLRLYARRRGLRRLVIPVPFLTPRLSGWWLYLFTPKQATVGRQLAESLRYPTVVTSDAAARDFPHIRPIGATEAVDRAFREEERVFAATCWAKELAAPRRWGSSVRAATSTRGPSGRPVRRSPRSIPSHASAASAAGMPLTRCGMYAGSSTSCSADRGTVADVGTSMRS